MNHFKTALNDPEFKELYKDKPFHMAILHAFAAYIDQGYSLHDLPWFPFSKKNKSEIPTKKAA